jgi:hypothetical protein
MKQALSSSETSVLTRATRRSIPEDTILYMARSLLSVLNELSIYKFDFVGVQDIRWEGSWAEPEGEYTFFYEKRNQNYESSRSLFYAWETHISS